MVYLRFYDLKRDDTIVVITEDYSDSIDLINRYRENAIEIEEITLIDQFSIVEASKLFTRIFRSTALRCD